MDDCHSRIEFVTRNSHCTGCSRILAPFSQRKQNESSIDYGSQADLIKPESPRNLGTFETQTRVHCLDRSSYLSPREGAMHLVVRGESP